MRIGVSSGSSMHRPTRNFTPTRTWPSRARETPPRSARSGSLCGWPAPPRAHVSSRLPRTAGASRPRNAARKMARSSTNVFAIESFIEELAHRAGKDSIAFRRAHLDKTPRLQAALDLVREKSGWGTPLPARVGRGVSIQPAFGSFIATVVEAEVDDKGEVYLRRVTSAVDTGIAVNPDTIVAQLQGGLIFGLTAALYGEVTIDKGRVQQSNFNDYRILRIDQVPNIDVHLIKSGEAPSGIGEAGCTARPPALRNRVFG